MREELLKWASGEPVLPMDQQIRFLNAFQARMNLALHAQLQALADASDPEPITLDDFPKALVSRFVSSEGRSSSTMCSSARFNGQILPRRIGFSA